MEQMDCVLLVDDSITANFYNKKILNTCHVTKEIVEVHNGEEALHFLKACEIKNEKKPNVIFLDINMPVMDGFEFLEEYMKFPYQFRADILISLLTTSNWKNDMDKAKERCDFIFDFIEKPLAKKDVQHVYEFYKSQIHTV
ncbi:response regulator [Aquimarina agarilytica]|uniref:response regulator n=1 Tax=Aquimarina agarilytica TaxID=1087449 RepID=UPI00028A2DE1|nr:response regulator [Aquimarina agarilytica]